MVGFCFFFRFYVRIDFSKVSTGSYPVVSRGIGRQGHPQSLEGPTLLLDVFRGLHLHRCILGMILDVAYGKVGAVACYSLS